MTALTGPVPVPLPRGPHRLTRAEVATSQRDRLCIAALEAVAEAGYAPTTITDIVRRARVARRTFYDLFDSKEECFTAAFDFVVDTVARELDRAASEVADGTFADLVRTTLTAYLDMLMSEPAAARALHVEALAAGPALIAHRARVHRMFANRMLSATRIGVQDGSLRAEPEIELIDVLVGGIDDRIRATLIDSGPQALPALAPVLHRAALALLGSAAA